MTRLERATGPDTRENISVKKAAAPNAETTARSSDGIISIEMIRRGAMLRAEQKVPFPEDSVDLIREAREERDAEL